MATNQVTINNRDLSVEGYLALPEVTAKGSLIVIHEVWGLNKHTEDVARRFAQQGYVVLAPDLLSGTPAEGLNPEILHKIQDPATRNEAQKEMRTKMGPIQSPEFSKVTIEKLRACFDWLTGRADTGGKVAVVGFCFGGSYAFALARAEPKLRGAVPFYGHCDDSVEGLRNINCPVLAFYGDQDTNLTNQLPELIQKMAAAGRDFTHKVYPGTGHAFFNDTNPSTYDKAAAEDAWRMTLDFIGENMAKQ